MWKNLYIAETTGSENGKILADEEYKNACRITLEKCERYYAITCGIYGGMVHTAFSGNEHYQEMYEAMKKDLQEFIDNAASDDEEFAFYDKFTEKY